MLTDRNSALLAAIKDAIIDCGIGTEHGAWYLCEFSLHGAGRSLDVFTISGMRYRGSVTIGSDGAPALRGDSGLSTANALPKRVVAVIAKAHAAFVAAEAASDAVWSRDHAAQDLAALLLSGLETLFALVALARLERLTEEGPAATCARWTEEAKAATRLAELLLCGLNALFSLAEGRCPFDWRALHALAEAADDDRAVLAEARAACAYGCATFADADSRCQACNEKGPRAPIGARPATAADHQAAWETADAEADLRRLLRSLETLFALAAHEARREEALAADRSMRRPSARDLHETLVDLADVHGLADLTWALAAVLEAAGEKGNRLAAAAALSVQQTWNEQWGRSRRAANIARTARRASLEREEQRAGGRRLPCSCERCEVRRELYDARADRSLTGPERAACVSDAQSALSRLPECPRSAERRSWRFVCEEGGSARFTWREMLDANAESASAVSDRLDGLAIGEEVEVDIGGGTSRVRRVA